MSEPLTPLVPDNLDNSRMDQQPLARGSYPAYKRFLFGSPTLAKVSLNSETTE